MKKNTMSGERIKFLREINNFTQKNIAVFLGVDQSLIARVEKDERALSSDLAERLASLFGVRVSAFEEGSNEMPLTFAFRASDLNEKDMATISDINRIALNCRLLASLLDKEGNADENR